MAGAKREPSSLVQLTDAERRVGLDAGVVQRANHFQRRQRAEDAVELAAGRLGVEMRADADRRLRHVAAGAHREHRAQRIDMHLAAGSLAGRRETSRAPACLPAQCQPLDAAFRRAAEFRRLVDRAPEPRRIDLEIGGDLVHASCREFRSRAASFQ